MSSIEACSRALKEINIASDNGSTSSKSAPKTPASKPSASVAQRYNALLTQAKQFEKGGDAPRALAA